MFYLLYLHYADIAQDYPLLNLVQYQTVRVALAMATAMIVAVAMGSRFIAWIRIKQGKGQPIRADGPVSHLSKVGTPTMGGLMILAGIAVAVLLWGDLTNPYIWIVSFVTAAFGVLGFIDDYAKVTKQTSAGLTSRQKLVAQVVVSLIAGTLTVLWMTASPTTPNLETSIAFPFFKAVLLNVGWFYVLFAAFTLVGFSNAVNLTDGLDGLASGTVAIPLTGLAACLVAYAAPATAAGTLVLVAAVIGGCLGFLWFNAHPAEVFMGDTGSLGLGAAVAGAAVLGRLELWLIPIGALFIAETLSVMIQVAYFKRTGGKRFFKMSPLHHHFELSGWKETKVVARFYLVAAMCSVLAVALL
ncbi:MAG: phospho-N-acetylmuramoyl-pentapeptide-transferase [Caulobacterales bacterium]|nr:phospho-N-acetylmuramoyl-pentapeptide-transferase [Caulobacterales bacterium]